MRTCRCGRIITLKRAEDLILWAFRLQGLEVCYCLWGGAILGAGKRHINIWHINNFSVTLVTDPPGREPDSSRPGTRTKTFMFLGFRTQHINFWPLATGRETPPPTSRETPPPPGQSPEKFVYVYVPFPFLTSRPSPGSDPGPVQIPSRVRGGPVQIRHVLCFSAFRTHPGPEVGATPARPGPILVPSVLPGSGLDGPKQTSWPLPILGFENQDGKQGTQNYLPPPPESEIEPWVPKSTVDTQILESTGKAYLPYPSRDRPKFGRHGGGR